MRITTLEQRQVLGKTGSVILFVVGICCASACASTDAPVAESQFIQEVTKAEYKETVPPPVTPVFRWDFSNSQVVHRYTFKQTTRSSSNTQTLDGENAIGSESETSASGVMLIKSQGDGTADIVTKDMRMSMKVSMGDNEPRTIEQQMPPVVVQGLQEDGSGSYGDSDQDAALEMLFPLPPTVLEVGDSIDVPLRVPFNAMGSRLHVTGNSRITLTRYVTIGERTCAQLDVETDISKLDIPEELEGEYEYTSKGNSVFYFDVGTRMFVSGTITVVMRMSVDAPVSQPQVLGEETPVEPGRFKMDRVDDSLIQVTLEE